MERHAIRAVPLYHFDAPPIRDTATAEPRRQVCVVDWLSVRDVQMSVSAIRPVQPEPEPQEMRHVVLRSGNEDVIGAQVVGRFATEHEAIEEGERLFAKHPDFHFWHVVLSHKMQRTTVINSRSI